MFIVDLGVPRDVEPEAADLDDIFLYCVDELQEIVKGNLQIRREAVVQAERMIAEQTAHFLQWLDGRAVVPTIDALSGHHDDAARDRARARAADARRRATPEAVLEALARGLTSKLLHPPLSALNTANEAERAELIARFARLRLERIRRRALAART